MFFYIPPFMFFRFGQIFHFSHGASFERCNTIWVSVFPVSDQSQRNSSIMQNRLKVLHIAFLSIVKSPAAWQYLTSIYQYLFILCSFCLLIPIIAIEEWFSKKVCRKGLFMTKTFNARGPLKNNIKLYKFSRFKFKWLHLVRNGF